MTRDEFLARMEQALQPLAPHERIDVLGDYAEHFRAGEESGKPDEEIARALGDPEALARIYLEQKGGDAPAQTAFVPPPSVPAAVSAPPTGQPAYAPGYGAPPSPDAAVPAGFPAPPTGNQAVNQASNQTANTAVATLLVILFNLIIGIPVVCGVVGAALAVPGTALGFLAAAVALFVIAAALMVRPLVGGAVICFGLACLALTVVLGVATVALARLLARVLTRYVRLCVRICREGRWPR